MKHPGRVVVSTIFGLLTTGCASIPYRAARDEMEQTRLTVETHLHGQGLDPGFAPQTDLSQVPTDSTHVVFVVDTSGSMRDEATDAFKPQIVHAMLEILRRFPRLEAMQLLDADGRFITIYGKNWIPVSRQSVLYLLGVLVPDTYHSNSSPLPGMARALSELYDSEDSSEMRLAIIVLGDELVANSPKEYDALVARGLDSWTDNDPAIRIHVIQFALDSPYPRYLPLEDLPRFIAPLAQLYRGVYIQWPR